MLETIGLLASAVGLVIASVAVHRLRVSTVGGGLERGALAGPGTRTAARTAPAWRAGHLAAASWLATAVRAGYSAGALTAAALLTDVFSGLAWALATAGYIALAVCLAVGTAKANAADQAPAGGRTGPL
ncbi:hypothetical protein [Nocardiopsis sp. CNT312]|uniref:hypothetical protein n=1 Tax=Nocardiopsis sp. CNT312 TaxID=1137268 RepID=UPI00049207DD|nr:hypothetical protein [Nocardiopsis sp. CNT312]